MTTAIVFLAILTSALTTLFLGGIIWGGRCRKCNDCCCECDED